MNDLKLSLQPVVIIERMNSKDYLYHYTNYLMELDAKKSQQSSSDDSDIEEIVLDRDDDIEIINLSGSDSETNECSESSLAIKKPLDSITLSDSDDSQFNDFASLESSSTIICAEESAFLPSSPVATSSSSGTKESFMTNGKQDESSFNNCCKRKLSFSPNGSPPKVRTKIGSLSLSNSPLRTSTSNSKRKLKSNNKYNIFSKNTYSQVYKGKSAKISKSAKKTSIKESPIQQTGPTSTKKMSKFLRVTRSHQIPCRNEIEGCDCAINSKSDCLGIPKPVPLEEQDEISQYLAKDSKVKAEIFSPLVRNNPFSPFNSVKLKKELNWFTEDKFHDNPFDIRPIPLDEPRAVLSFENIVKLATAKKTKEFTRVISTN